VTRSTKTEKSLNRADGITSISTSSTSSIHHRIAKQQLGRLDDKGELDLHFPHARNVGLEVRHSSDAAGVEV